MALILKKESPAGVTPPDSSRVKILVDESGNPVTKNHAGVVSPLITVDGTPIPLDTQVGDPPVTPGTRGKMFARLVSGVVELFWRDDTGRLIQITQNGGVAGGVSGGKVFTPRWSDVLPKTGLPGEYWEDGETCDVAYGDSLMIDLSGGILEQLTVNLPVMTATDAGKQVQLISVFDDNAKGGYPNPGGGNYEYQYIGNSGTVKLVPQTGDAILDAVGTGPGAGNQQVNYWYGADGYGFPYPFGIPFLNGGPWSCTLMADGNGRWLVSADSRVFLPTVIAPQFFTSL